MRKTLHKARIHLFISGLCSLAFGIIVLIYPSMPLSTLVKLFAGYMILKGLALSLAALYTRREEIHWLYLLSYGLLNVTTGMIAFLYPEITLLLLGFIVSINFLMGGILQIMVAIHLHREIKETGWLIFSGIITLIAGAYIYLLPRIGATTILYLIAAAALIVSIFMLLLTLRAYSWRHHHPVKQFAPMQ